MSKALTLPRLSAILFLICLMAATTYPAWAIESTSGAINRKDKRLEKMEARLETRVENFQYKMETMQEKIASREAQLKAKLQTFKDQRKAAAVDRINTNLNRINQQQSQQMLKHLDKMTAILNRLGDNAKPEDIASASASIAAAKAAVSAQALNDYTITVTSEATVKENSKAARDKLHSDLMTVRKLIKDAKEALVRAIRVSFPQNIKEGTPSGNE